MVFCPSCSDATLIFSLQKKLEHVETTHAHLDKVITKNTASVFL